MRKREKLDNSIQFHRLTRIASAFNVEKDVEEEEEKSSLNSLYSFFFSSKDLIFDRLISRRKRQRA